MYVFVDFKAKLKAIPSDTHQLHATQLHHFTLNIIIFDTVVMQKEGRRNEHYVGRRAMEMRLRRGGMSKRRARWRRMSSYNDPTYTWE